MAGVRLAQVVGDRVDEFLASDEPLVANVERLAVDVRRFDRQQNRVAQVFDRRVVEQPIAAADDFHFAGLDFFDDARERMPLAGTVDEAGPQDHGVQVCARGRAAERPAPTSALVCV